MDYADALILLIAKLKRYYNLNPSCTFEFFELGEDNEEGFSWAVKIWGMGDPLVFAYDKKTGKGWEEKDASAILAPSER